MTKPFGAERRLGYDRNEERLNIFRNHSSGHWGLNNRPMKASIGLRIKTYVLIVCMITLAPLGNVCLSKGMKGISIVKNWSAGGLLGMLAKILISPYIWLGIALLLGFFVSYMLILTWADYSYVQPTSSFSFAIVALWSYLLLGEYVSPLRWAGIAVICLGVFIVGHTHPRTTEKT